MIQRASERAWHGRANLLALQHVANDGCIAEQLAFKQQMLLIRRWRPVRSSA